MGDGQTVLGTLSDITITFGDIAVIAMLILSVVQIAPIKINPWSFIMKALGHALNKNVCQAITDLGQKFGKLQDEVEALSKQVDEIKVSDEEYRAIEARIRILNFCNNLMADFHYTKDAFDQIIGDIDMYEAYTVQHPLFKNNQTVSTIKYIKSYYQKMLENHSFRQMVATYEEHEGHHEIHDHTVV